MLRFFATLQAMLRKLFFVLATLLAFSGFYHEVCAAQQQEARPFYYTREITRPDLDGRSLRELTLMRNTIYARAGNRFRKKWLNDYFSAQSWYHPLDKMDESKITPLDRKNAEIISKYDADIPRDELLSMQQALRAENLVQGPDGKLATRPPSPEDKIELRLISMRL